MIFRPIFLFSLLLTALSFAQTTAPAPIRITGQIITTQKITRLLAVDRAFADPLKTSQKNPKDPFLYEATLDPKNNFIFDKLLPTHTYDLILWTTNPDGTQTRWEGADLSYHRDINPSTALTAEDQTWLENFVKDMPSFYDKSRILHMAADHQHATLLVELARTRDFHSAKGGEVIYRVELWYFENLYGGWAKDKNTEKVLVRWRGDGKDIEQNWQFLPTLANLSPGQNLSITLPNSPDEKIGLTGGIPK